MIRIYVSHSIRGKYGINATHEQMNKNNELAIAFGKKLKRKFPNVYFHVPAEHEEFIQKAYDKGLLTEKQILDIDCEILNECNLLLVYSPDNFISRGMQVEIDYAVCNNIPIIYCYFLDLSFEFIGGLDAVIEQLEEDAKKDN